LEAALGAGRWALALALGRAREPHGHVLRAAPRLFAAEHRGPLLGHNLITIITVAVITIIITVAGPCSGATSVTTSSCGSGRPGLSAGTSGSGSGIRVAMCKCFVQDSALNMCTDDRWYIESSEGLLLPFLA